MSEASGGIRRWLTTTDHKDVGLLYLWTSLVMLLVGGVLGLLVRAQLAVPGNDFLTPEVYNQVFTMHGVTMVFFFISPFAFGFANYIVPIQIGARDMAFPRVNALSYWLYLSGAIVALSGFALGGAANAAWTFYTPLSVRVPTLGVDLAAIGLLLLVASVAVSTINFLVTIMRHRAPDVTYYRMPLFTWSIVFTLIIMLIAFTVFGGALLMLLAERRFGMPFFVPEIDGTILWQHVFWFFGHPEVYIVLLPGLGAILEIIPVFARRPIYGKRFILYAFLIALVYTFSVWVHHMFVTGIDVTLRKFFTLTTEIITIPFGIIYLCCIATLWGGAIRYRTPMLFSIGFLALFLIGGLTGVFLSSVALDYDFRGTYFVIAHFHYTFGGGALFGLLAALYFWFPKMTGRMMSERLGHASFWLALVGANLLWLSQFGAREMPRRVVTYPAEAGWSAWNLASTVGAFVFGLGVFITVVNAVWSLRRGERAGPDPWGAESLEWTLPSPPPPGNFESPPTLRVRDERQA